MAMGYCSMIETMLEMLMGKQVYSLIQHQLWECMCMILCVSHRYMITCTHTHTHTYTQHSWLTHSHIHTHTHTHTFTHTVGLHKKIVSTMLSNSSKITHHYEIGSEFRGYAAKMTHEWVAMVMCSYTSSIAVQSTMKSYKFHISHFAGKWQRFVLYLMSNMLKRTR